MQVRKQKNVPGQGTAEERRALSPSRALNNVAKLRNKARKTEAELGRAIGVGEAVIIMVETRGACSSATRQKLAGYFGKTVAQVFPPPFKLLRRASGKTQRQVAKEAGVNVDSVARADKGVPQHIQTQQSLAAAIGATLTQAFPQAAAKLSQQNPIVARRESLGMTQQELADKAEVARRTVHVIEKGRSCAQDTMRKVLRVLRVPWKDRMEFFPPPQQRGPAPGDRKAAKPKAA